MKRLLAALALAAFPALKVDSLRPPMLSDLFERSVTPERSRPRGTQHRIAYRLSRALFFASVIMIALAASGRGAHAAGPTMFVSPASASAGVGNDIALDLDAANIPSSPGLGGYVIALQWNPAILTLTSLADAGWVTSGQVVVACTTPAIDNTNGRAELDCTPLFALGAGVSPSGTLAHAVFHTMALGGTVIDITGSSLVDASGNTISSTPTNGSVSVERSVGGIAEAPDVATLPALAVGGSDHGVAFAAAGVLLAVAILGASLAAWRRRARAG